MTESWYRQEFCCSFESLEGLVYPDFAQCVSAGTPQPGRLVGGIDFGLRNPFAAIWGVVDHDDVLWLYGEHFSRDQSLAYHARHLPREVLWYGDPAGAREIRELHCAGLTIRAGDNHVTPGLAAVRARLESGRLKVLAGCCPNLLAEAQLYRYDVDSKSEKPVKEHDHALDALRYLVSRLDAKRLALFRRTDSLPPMVTAQGQAAQAGPPETGLPQNRKWLSIYDEALWTVLE
jgi:hypothetical protein